MKQLFLTTILLFPLTFTAAEDSPSAKDIIKQVVEANGGLDNFYRKDGVSYSYFYRAPDGKTDLSEEEYIFDGEKSSASYIVHEKHVSPDKTGLIKQVYDGKSTTVYHNEKPLLDPKAVKTADFLRKTNYYWFAMMFKLLDEGSNYEYLGEHAVNDKKYHKVELTYEENVGDVSDRYLLFVNQDTMLIDFFLFTVMDFNLTDPLIMKLQYQEIDDLLIPTHREYTQAVSWENPIAANEDWVEEISLNIKFKN